ncbi:MAG: UDP-2,3-diacylglucosamine diphosphatase [Pseudomonadota bacterium]
MIAYFLSDLHLKTMEESNSQKLLLFLHSLAEKKQSVTHLFLVGDIFDLWISDHQYFVEKFLKIVNAIKVVVQKGVEVHYFEGNHDLYLKKFWQQEVGVRVHEGPEFFKLGPYQVRVEHGDFMNPDDKGYLFLRAFLRSDPLKKIAKNLPGRFVKSIGQRASRMSRSYTSNQKKMHEEQVKEFMRTYADTEISKKPFDFLITGHTHVEDIYHFDYEGSEVRSINLGSWFETQKVLELREDGFRFEEVEEF